MITFEKVTDVHFKVYNYGLYICSIGIASDSFIIYNRHNVTKIPKSLKKHLKTILIGLYHFDLKSIEVFKNAHKENEGMLSIKKLKKIIN